MPVLPVLIRYDSGGGSGRGAAAASVAAAAAGAALAAVALGSAGPGGVGVAVAGAAVVTAALLAGALDGRGGVSPCWESIDASWHLLLMLAQPFHRVICYEVRPMTSCIITFNYTHTYSLGGAPGKSHAMVGTRKPVVHLAPSTLALSTTLCSCPCS